MASTAGPVIRPAYLVYHAFWRSLDWLFPGSCGGCGRPGLRWCVDCQSSVLRISGRTCERCGQPICKGEICPACKANEPRYTALRSYAEFSGPVRNALHLLKYRGDISMGDALSRMIGGWFASQNWPIDIVLPVPLSPERIRKRGYNQAGLIANPLALMYGLPYRPGAINRPRDTGSQVGLSAAERRRNVQGAFSANPDQVSRRTVLVVDDVTTTGSTLNACAEALLDAGAKGVYGLTLARAILRPGHGQQTRDMDTLSVADFSLDATIK